MNKYGALAKEHWERVDPERYRAIEDPQTFFSDLGEQVSIQVCDLEDTLAGPDRPGETFLEKAGRLNMARIQAEEVVLSDLVWIREPESEEDEGDQPDPVSVAYLKSLRDLDEQMELEEEQEREREREAWLRSQAQTPD